MKLVVKKTKLNLKYSFKISRNKALSKETFIIGIISDSYCGLGEIITYPYYGQTTQIVKKSLKKLDSFLSSIEKPESENDILNIIGKAQTILYSKKNYRKEYNSVLNALNCALIDLFCKIHCISLFDFLIKKYFIIENLIYKKNMKSSFTIGIDTKTMIIKKIKEAKKEKILKIKLTNCFNKNKEIIDTIREKTSVPLRIDANCSWDFNLAAKMLVFLENKNIELIEQPFEPIGFNNSTVEMYRKILDLSTIPIILDESIILAEDIEKHKNLCTGVNLKLSKCGGISNTIKMIEIAKKNNLMVMIGCMIESSIGLNFALNLSPFCNFADLDGNLLLKNDPFLNLGNYRVIDGTIKKERNFPGIGLSYFL